MTYRWAEEPFMTYLLSVVLMLSPKYLLLFLVEIQALNTVMC